MEIKKIPFGNLTCTCFSRPGSGRVAYVLYPLEAMDSWIAQASERYRSSIVVISGMDWDNDLTPWKAPGVPEGSPAFKGGAGEFFNRLTEIVIPSIEHSMDLDAAPERTLIGVSLSGLFALWQWPQSDFFRNIATLSGSFGYEDFVQWVSQQPFTDKTGLCFMLLGEAEPRSRNPIFATVGKCTGEIVDYLRRQGVRITYKTVEGNHYQYPLRRLDMALSHIYGSGGNTELR